MSVQTDCEILSIEIIEAYAEKYDLSGEEAFEFVEKMIADRYYEENGVND